ncbi:hypothetical protein TNCV_4214951 [Trichonephila clavipes]|nr:hypothetical protein TNCV_4214951 [Trichonephila clavipes]
MASSWETRDSTKSDEVARWLNVEMIFWMLVCFYAGAIGEAFVLRDDNARFHRTRIVIAYLQQETIQCLQR